MIDQVVSTVISKFIDEHDWSTPCKRQRRGNIEYWDTPWGEMLQDPDLLIADSAAALKFRRRFRLPYPLFKNEVLLMCKQHRIFGKTHVIPM